MSRYRENYTLFKRGAYWYYRTYDSKGVRTSGKSTGKKSKNQAREFCENLYKSGALIPRASELFGAYSFNFFDADGLYFRDRVNPVSINTIKVYQSIFKKNIFPFFKNYDLNKITNTTLKTFRGELLESGVSLSHTKTVMTILKIIIDSAYRDRIIRDNPFDFLTPLKAKNQKRDSFTLEEVKFIYSNMNKSYKDFILLLALTGLRLSEALGFHDNKIIKSPEDFIFLDVKVQNSNGNIIGVKWDSVRPVPIIPEIVELSKSVFPNENKRTFYRDFNRVKALLDIEDGRVLSVHSLRHFFNTNAKSSGILESKVEKLCGHKLQGIQDIYTNYKAEDLKEILVWQRDIYEKITK